MTPQLRFPGFPDAWRQVKLKDISWKVNERNDSVSASSVLTNSAVQGVVAQTDFFSKEIAVQGNLSNYYRVKRNDFVYNPRISSSAPVGPFKRNHLGEGVMSPLYVVFRFNENESLSFFEHYLSSSHWHQYMKSIANYGARSDRMAISGSDLAALPLPYPNKDEQQKVAKFLTQVDKKISKLEQKVEKLEAYKKGVMQKIFSQEIRFKDESGNDYPEWGEKTLLEISSRVTEKNSNSSVKRVLTNSATEGIVSQSDYFDKDIANQSNLAGYYVVSEDDFVYNPRISTHAPVGPIKRNNLSTGVMSPLYTVFRIVSGLPGFYEHYFVTDLWHDYLRSVANSGARHDRMNITNKDFYAMPVPVPSANEQQKIAQFIDSVDVKIQLEKLKLKRAHDFKQALLHRMFV